jgi:peptidoglycan hydrolase-like protein with peptidoglycan-binding domain
MHKQLATLMLGMLLAVPYVATAASPDRSPGSLPAAVDQQLAKDMIQQAETQLKLAGFDPGRVDGVFDMRTAQAVRQYQVAHALPVSGALDAPTRRVMFPGFDDANED